MTKQMNTDNCAGPMESVIARPAPKRGMASKKLITNTIVHVILGILAFIWVSPIAIIIMTSFRKEQGGFVNYIIPRGWTFDNYIHLFHPTGVLNFPRWALNTFIVAIFSCLLSSFFVLCVSYVMSRLQFRSRKTFMSIALVLGMFPGFMSVIAIYYILKGMGLLDQGAFKLFALVLVYSGGAGLGFYVAKGFFDTIPKTIDEAAYIDGATKWTTFWRITVPLSKPVIVTTVLAAFMAPWTDFIIANVILGQDVNYFTVAIGLFTMLTKENILYYFTQFYAACVVISIPIAALSLYLQKFYAEGTAGAVKG